MWIYLVGVIVLIAALLIPAAVYDARRRRKGLPVNGPDGLRGYTTTPSGVPAVGGIAVGGGADAGGAGCDGGGGGDGGGGC